MTIPIIKGVTLDDMHSRPYEVYKRLRKDMPIALLPATGRVLVTRYDDVRMIKMDADLFTSEDTTTPAERAFQDTSMMRKDGAEHKRERMSIAPALSAKLIRNVWKEIAERSADRLFSTFEPGQTVDLFSQFAAPFAGEVLGQLLGLTDVSGDDVVRWSQVLIDGAGNVAGNEEIFRRSDAVNDEVNASIAANIERLKENPDNSILQSMAFGKHPQPVGRIRCNIKVSIGGGVNEPRDAFLTTVFGLLTNPEQLAVVKDDPSHFRAALEESVRWVAPIQTSPRKTKEEVELSGIKIPADTPLTVVQASANRDEDYYTNGDVFDITRPSIPHHGFGNGAHFCMGTHLSRMSIGEVALPMLFERFPNITLQKPEEVPWYGFTFHGPLELNVRL